jgi:hypothetical protein
MNERIKTQSSSLYCEIYVRYITRLYESWAVKNRHWIERTERLIDEKISRTNAPFPPPRESSRVPMAS